MESDSTSVVFTERPRLWCRAAVEKMQTELSVRRLSHFRSTCDIHFCEDVLKRCMTWFNKRISILAISIRKISVAKMYCFLVVFMFCQYTGFNLEMSITILENINCAVPSLPLCS